MVKYTYFLSCKIVFFLYKSLFSRKGWNVTQCKDMGTKKEKEENSSDWDTVVTKIPVVNP